MASQVFEQEALKASSTPATAGLAIAAPELWVPVQEALQGLAVRVVMEQRDLRNWPSLIERLEFLAAGSCVAGHLRRCPCRLKKRCSESVARCPIACWWRSTPAAQPETILAAMRAGANEFLYPPLGNNLRKAVERRAEIRPGRGRTAARRARSSDSSRPKAAAAPLPLPATWRPNWAASARSGPSTLCWSIWTCNRELSAS